MVFGTSHAEHYVVSRLKKGEIKMMYRFILLKDAEEIMGTDVDEPKPQIDAEFWDRFMQGDCEMRFVKSYEE